MHFGDEDCKIAWQLNRIHDCTHRILRDPDITTEDLHAAHRLGHKILDLLNDVRASHEVKILAVFEVLGVGVDALEHEQQCAFEEDAGTATIQ